MRKHGIGLLVPGAALGLFLLWFFLVTGTRNPASVWMGFGFCVLALVCLAVPSVGASGERAFDDVAYFLVAGFSTAEFVAGLVVILLSPTSWATPLLVLIAIPVVFFVAYAVFMRTADHAATRQGAARETAARANDMARRVKAVRDDPSLDGASRRAVQGAYDALRSSQTRTSPDVQGVEARMAGAVYAMEQALRVGDANVIVIKAHDVERLCAERERILSREG